jgi:hypothetical protein
VTPIFVDRNANHGTTIRCLIGVLAGCYLLWSGIKNIKSTQIVNLSTLWALGFGKFNTTAVVGRSFKGIFVNIILANMPQLILSFIYLYFNGYWTCMLAAKEWSGYAHEKKSLRVTSPMGTQRSTYWLQLPYTYAIPLLVFSAVLNWLVSQALFLAPIDAFDSNGVHRPDRSITKAGYSIMPIIFALILSFFGLVLSIANGFRKYRPGMPFAASCSAVMSAACHPAPEEHEAAVNPVKWGCIKTGSGEVGHCSFSSSDVTEPLVNNLYMGWK